MAGLAAFRAALSATERAGRPLGAVEWIALAVAVCATVFALHGIFAPGFMSFDSLLFYKQAVDGVTRSTWPPMYAYLIRVTRWLGGGYGALFLAQNAALFSFGGFIVLRLSGGSRLRRLVALAIFMAAFIAVPPLLGSVIVLWNVVPVAAFMLAGAAFQLVGVQSGRWAWGVAASLAYAVCFALRYDSIFLIAPLMLALLAFPAGGRSGLGGRGAVWAATAVGFTVAYLSFSHRLPDFRALPPNAGVRTIQTFDLIGVSARCGENFLAPAMNAGGPMSLADIRAHYDPRHLNLSVAARPGLRAIPKADAAQVNASWWRAVGAHPGCYLQHRWAVFVEQMGAAPGGLFYATHGGIDANPYGFTLDNPAKAAEFAQGISAAADHPLRRPIWLYVGALAAVLALRRDARLVPLGLLTLGAFAYAASHLFVSAAADARYIFASNVVCAAVIAVALGGRRR